MEAGAAGGHRAGPPSRARPAEGIGLGSPAGGLGSRAALGLGNERHEPRSVTASSGVTNSGPRGTPPTLQTGGRSGAQRGEEEWADSRVPAPPLHFDAASSAALGVGEVKTSSTPASVCRFFIPPPPACGPPDMCHCYCFDKN